MGVIKKCANYWNYETCKEEALKHASLKSFRKINIRGYRVAHINGWLDEITSHMIKPNPRGYWTKERCYEEALKYKTRNEFRKKSNNAYGKAHREGWLKGVCSHMREPNYWDNKNRCYEEALKYQSRMDFSEKNCSAYRFALKRGWLDKICSHMEIQGNIIKRLIYAYEFPDNHVYVGLTFNIKRRNKEHNKCGKKYNSKVYNHIQKTGLDPKLIIHSEYIEVKESQKLEGIILNDYKEKGWIILNKARTGGLGNNILIWTYEKCKIEALKYEMISKFYKNSPSAYSSARINGWLNDITFHMEKNIIKPKKYWNNKENCINEALKYKNGTDFILYAKGAYGGAKRNGWIEECYKHMDGVRKGYWNNKHNCELEALKYNKITEFRRKSSGAYEGSKRNNWLDEITSHIIKKNKFNKEYWNNKENCINEALKYCSKYKFSRASFTAYRISIENNWIDEFFPIK